MPKTLHLSMTPRRALPAFVLLTCAATLAPAAIAPFAGWPTLVVHQGHPLVGGALEPGDQFGSALASGDFDCDGFDDLAIASPFESLFLPPATVVPEAGLVHVVFGSPGGLSSRSLVIHEGTLGASPLGGLGSLDRFGRSLTAGNFNGDSIGQSPCDDLAIGVPDENIDGVVNAGAAWVLLGGPENLLGGGANTAATPLYQEAPNVTGVSGSSDNFGHRLAAGDFDGDGFDELVVSSLKSVDGQTFAGALWIFKGSAVGITTLNTSQGWVQYLTQNTPGVPDAAELLDRFGSSLAVCDLDGDTYDDLLIGSSGEDREGLPVSTDFGTITAMFGAATGIDLDHPGSRQVWGTPRSLLGTSLATLRGREFDGGPARCEVAAGASLFDYAVNGTPVTNAGRFHILLWDEPASALTPLGSWTEADVGTQAVRDQDQFALTLAAGDFDGDGLDHLLASVPFKDYLEGLLDDSGGFYWLNRNEFDYTGAFFRPDSWGGQLSSAGPDDSLGFGNLGRSLALGDFDADGLDDLAIGAPLGEVSGLQNAGYVRILTSSSLSLIFLDGFENGTTAAWSAASP